MRVHNELGPGLKETMYHRALSTAMRDAGLTFEHEKQLEVDLDGERAGLLYMDHFVEECVVVETKVLAHLLTNEEVAQVITYLAVSGAPVGLLLNFGRPRLQYKRILPPKKFTDWHKRVRRYVWTTDRVSTEHPLIRSSSAV
jgi:GxxExxY protein